ncbi:hypothetical protein N8I77_000270 [Diaporthe amygdali]|uniref:Uncharacterized protein n=1 Tax=Phomopsis amygdali TaxID=1214568 RepID=A0AAD9W6Y5_PHOAM|nr:hypothetical protein N8I77_000270 [Diaporthe amygdali]
MVSLRFDSLLQQDDDDALKGRQAPAPGEAGFLWTRDDDDDDKFKAVDDDDEDDDDFPTSLPPPPPPAFTPPPTLTSSSSSTKSSKSSETDTDTDSDSSTSTTSTSQTTTLSIPPILTSTLTTPTSSPQVTSQPQTNLPLLTSSALPSTTSSGAIFVGTPGGQETGKQQSDRGGDDGRPRGPSTSCKVAIAFGVIAAVGLIVGLFWAAILIRRRRRRHGQDEVNPRDYASRIGRRSRFNFNLPSIPPLPFSFTSPLERFYKPKPEAIPKRQVSNPFNAVHVSGHRNARSDSSILNEAIQAAYQMNGGSNDAVPQGFLDEKRRDPNHLLPLLDPEPIEQASIRKSVVSWFKRSSRHHPLKLNPSSGNASLRSSTGSTLTGGRRSRPGSQATLRTASYHSSSGDSALAESSGARGMQDVPPLPDLGLQKAYTNNTAPPAPSPTESSSESVTAPLPVFTRDDAQAYYKSMWAGSSVSGETERMSAMSSWTDVTRTTMAGGRSSAMNTPGLSPPPSFHINSNRGSAYPETPITPGFTSTTGSGSAEGTRTKEDLYALYAPTRGSVAGSAVGLGLQQQLQQQQQSQSKPAAS